MDRKEIFSKTYNENLFKGNESKSGPGSDISSTILIRKEITRLCSKLNIRSILDAPCGDCNWMKHLWPVLAGQLVNYRGIDIVQDMIDKNIKSYQDEKSILKIRFSVADIVADPLPAADLVLCRDCLVHLTCSSAVQFLRNFVLSGSAYLLTTTFLHDNRENHDYADGTNWYPIVLMKPPFNLPKPRLLINEQCKETDENCIDYTDKSLGLWDREEIRRVVLK